MDGENIDPLVGGVPDGEAGAQGGGDEEVEGGAEVELRDTLESLGLELTETVRARVLSHSAVNGDVARAIDWIMENQHQLSIWSSEEDIPPLNAPESPAEPILTGQRVTILVDQRSGTVIEVHGLPQPRPQSATTPARAARSTPPDAPLNARCTTPSRMRWNSTRGVLRRCGDPFPHPTNRLKLEGSRAAHG